LTFSLSLFSLLSTAITVLPERVVVGFPNFAWAHKKNNKNFGKKICLTQPQPLGGDFLVFLKVFLVFY
jgi:hypothetical protein